MTKNVTTLLFDLGGVLIELGSVAGMMATSPFDDDEIWKNWIRSPSVREFESGLCSPEEFAASVIDEYRLTISSDEFLVEFNKWPRGIYPGAGELLEKLKTNFAVACLSNTNKAHWDGFLSHQDLMMHFHQTFMSHETGRLKPDTETFEHAIEHLGSRADEILFFDDNPANVAAALDIGMHAELTEKPEGVINKLNSLGIRI